MQVVPETVSHPLQPEKVEPLAGVAVNVTDEPLVKLLAQVPDEQVIPAGLLVTVPPPVPALVTESVNVDVPPVAVNGLALMVVPPSVVTLIGPVVAPTGTVALMVVEELTVKFAFTPLNWTLVAIAKFAPVIVTTVPTGPLVGETCVIWGGLHTGDPF